MSAPAAHDQPTPTLIFEIINSYQRTAAIRAALELDVFTAIGEGNDTSAALSKRCQATERGLRILCDYLVIIGLLTKSAQRYALVPDAAIFLDKRSPACIGSISDFLGRAETVELFMDLASIIRDPQSALAGRTAMEPENPMWVEFARAMAPLMAFPAEGIAQMVGAGAAEKWKVLDVAAGHGMFGIAIAKHNPNAEIYALDWPSVLVAATENAKVAGVASRHHLIPGSVFDVELGTGYNLVLVTNFFHHFDIATNESLLRKIKSALAPAGRVATLDFIPNDDRVTPPSAAAFSMTMLGHTTAGDAYTFAEYHQMFRDAGFSSSVHHPMPGPMSVIISKV
jgi:2-polyprenyl-3-methyl-5-hydroxy-6-metoxy-1,4-benzoquinol methylase